MTQDASYNAPYRGKDGRFEQCFAALRMLGRGALIGYMPGGFPNPADSLDLLRGMVISGLDVLEVGMPFSDPIGDGPTIQKANNVALKAGQTLTGCLELVRSLRKDFVDVPILLMGYINPILAYGEETFCLDARNAGVDGLLIVDLPPEESERLRILARAVDLRWIRLTTPTTHGARLKHLLGDAEGFVYHVSVRGVTGAAFPGARAIKHQIEAIKALTDIPVAVGFGIRTPQEAADICSVADGVVVGTGFIEAHGFGTLSGKEPNQERNEASNDQLRQDHQNQRLAVEAMVGDLAAGVRIP